MNVRTDQPARRPDNRGGQRSTGEGTGRPARCLDNNIRESHIARISKYGWYGRKHSSTDCQPESKLLGWVVRSLVWVDRASRCAVHHSGTRAQPRSPCGDSVVATSRVVIWLWGETRTLALSSKLLIHPITLIELQQDLNHWTTMKTSPTISMASRSCCPKTTPSCGLVQY